MPEPLVSIIIVNRNGIAFIEECLRSVFNSRYSNFEVILVDNDSKDGSLQAARKAFGQEQRLKILEKNNANIGPAACRNFGVKTARGSYLAFLDNDTKVEADWLGELVRVFESDKSIGAGQAKLLRMGTDNLYDCAGDYLGPLGFLIERSKGAKDTGQFDFLADILSAKSAASIIKKELFERIGGFDEDYFMYLEETDLSWRVWLAGFRVVFIPKAVVYHAFNTGKKDFKRYYSRYVVRYYGCRNYISTLIKNVKIKNLVSLLPLHVFSWLAVAFLFLFKGKFLDFIYITRGVFWNIVNLDILIKKHLAINRDIRRVDDSFIFERVKSKEGLKDYLRKAGSYTGMSL
ncbi:MAG: glycosyltransferase family 2 protein [Candidatus Omnitrophota bacterium]